MDFNPGLTAQSVSVLIEELHKLPGIGPKSAQRLAYYLLRAPREEAESLAHAILLVKQKVIFCSRCYNITETDPCAVCTNPGRDQKMICVVEEPLDILALERTGEYKGLYHVLHGALSPMDGLGPEELKIGELLARLQTNSVEEVILATNPNLEGEATAMYLHRLIAPLGVRVTHLAHGLPVGGDLEYADAITLTRAIQGRQAM
ncbi:MAG: recombination mediator RecR [Dehalococcoidia bacterium]|nr:recombination mediator RecR [Dehalococcoidia bacterium]